MPKKITKNDICNGVKQYLKGRKHIFDVGTGPGGSDWWRDVESDATITGVDLFFFPKRVPKNVTIYKMDASDLGKIKKNTRLEKKFPKPFLISSEIVNWDKKFDMVVANHVLEHVGDPAQVIKGMSNLLQKGGLVYVGFPESTNFTDIFYHLVHPDGGGHIQLLTKDKVIAMFKKNGFKLLSCKIWPDDWRWFETQYNWKSYMWPENTFLDQKKIKYLCDVFRKELTVQKGYYYGWEMVFEKL